MARIHIRKRINQVAESVSSNSRDYDALRNYGYRLNSAIACKKYMKIYSIFFLGSSIFGLLLLIVSMVVVELDLREISPLLFMASMVDAELSAATAVISYIFGVKVIYTFDLFGRCVEPYTYTETVVEVSHLYGDKYSVEKKEETYSTDTSKFGFVFTLFAWIGLFLSSTLWVWFYYLWVRKKAAKICKEECSDELIATFEAEFQKMKR